MIGASPVHTHTFAMDDLPTALRYSKERIDGAIKVVVKPQTVSG
jgi:L-iditol 2-dehydrogenase